jgi:hypothetical protein
MTTLSESTSEMLYSAFRRALGAWIAYGPNGEADFEIGEYADSPAACGWPSYEDKTIKFIGWIAGTDLGGTGPCGEDVAATTAEFAEFLMHEDFVLYGSPASIAAAEKASL